MRPLPGTVALVLDDTIDADDIPSYVRSLVVQVDAGTLPADVAFPLAPASTDAVRTIAGLDANVVVKWLDPLGWEVDDAANPPSPRFGGNPDYIAYFGDGWEAAGAPQYAGSGSSGWLWVNHEYVSGNPPTATTEPDGQQDLLVRFLRLVNVLDKNPDDAVWTDDELTTFVAAHKRQVGGSWFRVVQDPGTGAWATDLGAQAVRYDATSATLTRITGYTPAEVDHDDAGNPLPAGVASGILADCSGGQTPWGTIITAEENAQSYYGDVEPCWTSQQQFVAGVGCDPGAQVAFPADPTDDGAFSSPDVNTRHNRDLYGFLVEIDPGVAPGEYYGAIEPGVGHRKLGAMGRAHWENAAFATGPDWRLVPGQPIVVYAGDDRRSGRIYKFVSQDSYQVGMTRTQVRALLDEGEVWVAHFVDLDNDTGRTIDGEFPTIDTPGQGQWIRLSVENVEQIPPNAAALGSAGTTVGAALQDVDYNAIGGFADDNTVKRALFTASNKLGIRELNRPEDIEYDPFAQRLYVAFTNHGRRLALDENGVLYDPVEQPTASPTRDDSIGAIFAMIEADPTDPGASQTFTYYGAWSGAEGYGLYDAANPDNVMIDAAGGVWFGTDGNFGTNGHGDAIYYLDLDVSHATTYGLAFRVAAAPSDAEATGPAFVSSARTLFFNVQHPGEEVFSSWPQ